MSTFKHPLLIFLILCLLAFKFYKLGNDVPVIIQTVNLYDDLSNLEIVAEVNTKLKILEFKSISKIDRVIVYGSNGEVIKKTTPINNTISLNKINEKELYFSFISSKKMAFKSVVF